MDRRSPSSAPGVPWGIMDRALAAVSPASAARRYAARVAIANLRRGYEGGKTGRTTGNWSSTNASADAEIAAASGPLRSRSRELVLNNALAAQAVQVLVNNIVGPGIRPRAASGNRTLNRKVDKLWTAFARECDFFGLTDFYGLQNLAVRQMIEAGDILGLKITVAGERRPELVDLAVQHAVARCRAGADARADNVVNQHLHRLGGERVVAHQIAGAGPKGGTRQRDFCVCR